jgi:hypothetical protein
MTDHADPTRRLIVAALLAALPQAARAQSLLNEGRSLLGGSGGAGSTGSGAASSAGALGGGLSPNEIGSGLKDALNVASKNVVGRLGKNDGFNGDPAVRIPLPGPVQKIESPLKSMGASGMLDDLQLKMNRGAEEATPKAIGIFGDAVSKMSIDDARGILNGPKDAATQYFKRTASDGLTKAFTPIVDSALSSVGAVATFKSVQSKASSIPFGGDSVKGFDLTAFTVGKALDGVFHYLAVEEASIRTNPAARTTDLLKKVFS